MPANSGDKSRFHRLRKAKIARRVRTRAMRQVSQPQKTAKRSGS